MTGIQKSRDEPVMAAHPATGPSGNSTLTNLEECDVLDGTIEGTPVRNDIDPMFQEEDSYVQGVYATMISDVGGS